MRARGCPDARGVVASRSRICSSVPAAALCERVAAFTTHYAEACVKPSSVFGVEWNISPTCTASDRHDERHALDDVFCATYAELRRLATSVRRENRSLTLTPTALVHEAWIKLAGSPHLVASVSRLHFKRIAARAMRQVLVESARRRKASKRGGGETRRRPGSDVR